MARIPAGVIERLKAEVPVAGLAEARGVELVRHGADLIGRCPFHADRTPSLVITPAKNLWHCLGACQTGGTPIDWVMKAEGVSFRHAVEILQRDALPLAAGTGSSGPPPKQSSVPKLPTLVPTRVEDARLLAEVIGYYHQTLLENPEALNFLSRRGIGSAEAIETFRLGYANRTLGYRLPQKNRVEGEALRVQLQRLGIYRESGHEHLTGSLVIPVIGMSGEITEVYGRKLNDHLRVGTPKHLYLPGPHRGVWNEPALMASTEIILCEALIDALTFWCAGYRHVTASYGVEGFTSDHLAAFERHGTERVLIAYDRDEAGDRAAEKLSDRLQAAGIECYRIRFPKGMDANEYALRVGPAARSLGVVIQAAEPMGSARSRSSVSVSVAEPVMTPTVETDTVIVEADPASCAPASSLEASPEAAKEIDLAAATPPTSATVAIAREHTLTRGDRRYRVRGLEKNASFEALKVNVLVARPARDSDGEAIHVDTFDLYQARQRAAFVHQASIELGVNEEVLKADLGALLLMLETAHEAQLKAAREAPGPTTVTVCGEARREALALLEDPNLIARLAHDFSRSGIVGETTNALVGYLAAVSRKLDRPLALLIQSTSAAGKSSLLDAVLRFVPEEDRIVYSAMTGQSLFYLGEQDLKHKLLAIAEQEGAARAVYALKLLQSEGRLTIASTSKDATTGKLTTQEYRVEGPVMIAMTTTAAEIDEELLNRCLVLTIDEGRAQTQAIHAAQRERRTLAGLHSKVERDRLLGLHQNAQRLLAPLAVVNPYAERLTFLDDRTRTRRDHEKYLTLIDAIALLHQHQRPIHALPARAGREPVRYIEVTLEDIALANRLAHEVLGRTLDELPPQTRRLLGLIVAMVEEQCRVQSIDRSHYRFSRRALREHTCWGDTQLKVHLARLVELEYVLAHRSGRGTSFDYELLWDRPGAAHGKGAHGTVTQGEARHVSGLIDVEQLRADHGYDGERSGVNEGWPGSGRPPVGGWSADGRAPESPVLPEKSRATRPATAAHPDPARYRPTPPSPSYVPADPTPLAAV